MVAKAAGRAARWLGGALQQRSVPVVLALVFMVAQSIWTSQATRPMRRFSDERTHVAQVEKFCSGSSELHGGLTMLPGYHLLGAAMAKVTGDCSRTTLRVFNTGLGLLACLAALWLLLAQGSERAASRTLGFYFLPLLFPYHFVVFTDAPALVPALLALVCLVRRRWVLAGVCSAVAVCMRQTHVLVPMFIALVALLEQDRTGPLRGWLLAYLRKVWPIAIVLLGLAAFVLINKGVAIGDRDRHAVGFHVANVYFVLALLFFASLPVNLENLWEKRRDLMGSRAFMLALLIAYVMYMFYFDASHDYNSRPSCLRNKLLIWQKTGPLTKSLFFIPVSLGFASVWASVLRRRAYWVLVPLSTLILVPELLVEHRYGILPIAIWSLLRRDASASAEGISVLWNAGISLWLVYEITQGGSL